LGELAVGCFRAVVLAGICSRPSLWAVFHFDVRFAFLVGVVWLLLGARGILAVLGFGSDMCWYGYGFGSMIRGRVSGAIVFWNLDMSMKFRELRAMMIIVWLVLGRRLMTILTFQMSWCVMEVS